MANKYHYEEGSTPRGRFLYPHLATKTNYQDSTPAYEVVLLLPKSDPNTELFIQDFNNRILPLCAQSRWGAKINPAVINSPIRDGDRQELLHGWDKHGKQRPEVVGHYFIKFKDKDVQPYIVDINNVEMYQDGVPMGAKVWDYTTLKGGDYGRINFTFGPTEYAGKMFISAYLKGIQFLQEGEALGGGRPQPNPSAAFGSGYVAPTPQAPQIVTQAPLPPQVPAQQGQPAPQVPQGQVDPATGEVTYPEAQTPPASPTTGWGQQ